MKKILSIIPILFLINNVFSQSLLWKISGNGLKTPSYLYGTIHIQDKRVFAFDSTVTNAFNSCDAFAMEILVSDIKPEVMKKATIMKKGSIKELMSEEDYKLVAKVFHEKTGANLLLYDKMKPFFLSSQIEQADMPKDMDEALDLHFLKLAEKQEKATFGVEKFEQQVAAIDKISKTGFTGSNTRRVGDWALISEKKEEAANSATPAKKNFFIKIRISGF